MFKKKSCIDKGTWSAVAFAMVGLGTDAEIRVCLVRWDGVLHFCNAEILYTFCAGMAILERQVSVVLKAVITRQI